MKQKDIPNFLTLSRYATVPLFIIAWYLPFPWGNWLPLILVLLACLTDFFDGYLARKWQVQSELGRLLDPNADKLLIAVALVMLVSDYQASPVATALILCRELFISGLREFMAERQITVHVTKLAKWKTTCQMVAVIFLLIGHGMNISSLPGEAMLWIAALLTLWTGGEYIWKMLPYLRKQ